MSHRHTLLIPSADLPAAFEQPTNGLRVEILTPHFHRAYRALSATPQNHGGTVAIVVDDIEDGLEHHEEDAVGLEASDPTLYAALHHDDNHMDRSMVWLFWPTDDPDDGDGEHAALFVTHSVFDTDAPVAVHVPDDIRPENHTTFLQESDWEYDPSEPVPRRKFDGPSDPAYPEIDPVWRADYLKLTFKAFRRTVARTFLHKSLWTARSRAAFLIPPWGPLTGEAEDAQRLFPKNLTLKDTQSRSDAFFVERVLNGTHPCMMERDEASGDGDEHLKIVHNWDACDFAGPYEMPNVTARFKRTDQTLIPVSIEVQYRKPWAWSADALKGPGDFEPSRVYTPSDSEHLWEHAKRLFRGGYLMTAEIDMHIGRGHLPIEQVLVPLMRNVAPENPFFQLLRPHVRQVDRINHFGQPVIFGPHGVLAETSALTPRSIINRFRDQLGGVDWKGWSPRARLCHQDRYSAAAKLYWEAVTEHVEGFFGTHGTHIQAHWDQIEGFSSDLVTHAVPYKRHLGNPREAWWDGSEMSPETWRDTDGERPRIEGSDPSVHPVTSIEELKQLCRFTIFHATFFHSWTHNKQYEDGGEIAYASFGLRRRDAPPEDVGARVAWESSAMPSVKAAAYQLFVGDSLTLMKRGYLVKRQWDDWPDEVQTMAPLIKAVRDRRAQFTSLDVDIMDIRSRVNT